MDEIQRLKELNENIQDIGNIENEITMVQLAIYQKNIEKLKDFKMLKIREYFEQQIKFYNQKIVKYENEIENNINKYKGQLERLINIYDKLYVNIFSIMQESMNNQKIAVANIVTLKEKLNREKFEEEEEKNIKNIIMACAQKKLDYSVIIDECKARIKWCIENVQADINEIFVNKTNQLQLYHDNVFTKLKIKIFSKILGKNKFKSFLENYQNEYNDIRTKNNIKIVDLISVLEGIIKQMDEVKKQISINYEQIRMDTLV